MVVGAPGPGRKAGCHVSPSGELGEEIGCDRAMAGRMTQLYMKVGGGVRHSHVGYAGLGRGEKGGDKSQVAVRIFCLDHWNNGEALPSRAR